MRNVTVICVTILFLTTGCTNNSSYLGGAFKNQASKKSRIGNRSYSKTEAVNDYNDNKNCPAVGAIRWGAWYGSKDLIGQAEELVLTPPHWHYRLPFCAEIGKATVKINCATQKVMDQEITYAKRAGIDYWAFVDYPTTSPLSLAMENYLSSSKKMDINFSLIVTPAHSWNRDNYNKSFNRFISLMKDPSYQKLAGNRPLFYLYNIKYEWISKEWGGETEFKESIDRFRKAVKNASLGNPYIVLMEFKPEQARDMKSRFGFDAISTYAIPGDGGKGPDHRYQRLATNAERYWNRASTGNTSIIPTVMAGWDHRPRAENPVRDKWKEFSEKDKDKYYAPPTPKELANHLTSALNWVKFRSNYSQTNSVIIYAWDEFSEGGWIAPTLSEGTARLDAISEAIRRDCPVKR